MTDRPDFEARLGERLRARAALASRPFDAAVLARQAVTASPRRRSIDTLDWSSLRPALAWAVVALLLAIAVLGAVAVGGAVLRGRQPVQPAIVSNGLIAVSANPQYVGSGEMGDIYRLKEGAAARRIIGSDGDGVAQACPRFSPDGRRLAYGEGRPASQPGDEPVRGRSSVADRAVVVVALGDDGDATGPIVRVAAPAGPGPIACPEWSANGDRVAFRIGTELWVADATTGTATQFPVADAPVKQEPFEWSRDGSLIAVSEPHQIRLVRLDGGAPTVIPVQGGTPASLAWTAADESIVYLVTDEPGDGHAVHIVRADGSNDTQLVPSPADPADPQLVFDVADAVVSPDAVRVAYAYKIIRCTADGCSGDPQGVRTMDLDGSNVVDVPIPPDSGVSGLQWSPDGRRLLLGSIAGVFSVAASPGAPAIVHSRDELNLEWSGSEVTWQPVQFETP